MTAAPPTFVVVGNVNQGKSSIVASLAEESGVPIDSAPGTTTRCGEYRFKVGDRVVFVLIDTPGFQDARHALAWMRARSRSAADRKDVVQAFVREHEVDARFQDEVRLLRPVLEGASVLYVIDASSRFQPSHEAEMEVLRWAGQPAMALLNRTRERDFTNEWRPVLGQFFNVVREFNAHHAGFGDRMNLLRSFREVRDDWRAAMDAAISELEAEWAERLRKASWSIADLLVDALGHVERRRLEESADAASPALTEALRAEFEAAQRKFEKRSRVEVEKLYRHAGIETKEGTLSAASTDLFSEASWRLFGLSRRQLAQYGAAWGAALGGAIDLMVGGLTFFAGVAIGAAAGGLAGFFGGTKVARTWGERSRLAKLLFPGDTGRFVCMGPPTNPGYAWMLLDRALVHWRAVSRRSHARQDALDLAAAAGAEKRGVVASLDAASRDTLDRLLREILKSSLRGKVPATIRSRLADLLRDLLPRLGG